MTTFNSLIELFPNLVFAEDGSWIHDDHQYDWIADRASEVPYLLKAFILARKLSYLEELVKLNLEEQLAHYKNKLTLANQKYDNLLKAIQNVN